MHTDVHARIQQFLQQRSVAALPRDPGGTDPEQVTKAWVVPFMRQREGSQQAGQEAFIYFLMKPVARHAALAPPAFQLCKGTRMMEAEGRWVDMTPSMTVPPQGGGKTETLAATALREGIEELGLKIENIGRLLEVGPYVFSSAKSGREKQMWLFAAEVASRENFLPDAEVAKTTAEREWLSLKEFEVVGREDHRYILRDIDARLTAHHKE